MLRPAPWQAELKARLSLAAVPARIQDAASIEVGDKQLLVGGRGGLLAAVPFDPIEGQFPGWRDVIPKKTEGNIPDGVWICPQLLARCARVASLLPGGGSSDAPGAARWRFTDSQRQMLLEGKSEDVTWHAVLMPMTPTDPGIHDPHRTPVKEAQHEPAED